MTHFLFNLTLFDKMLAYKEMLIHIFEKYNEPNLYFTYTKCKQNYNFVYRLYTTNVSSGQRKKAVHFCFSM